MRASECWRIRPWRRVAMLLLGVGALAMTAGRAEAACSGGESATCFELSVVFKPREPLSAKPWLTIEVAPVNTTRVRLTMQANLDVEPETVAQVFLNVDPRIDSAHLTLVYEAGMSTGPRADGITRGVECCEAYDSEFDIRFKFPEGLLDDRFDGTEVVVYTVKCNACTAEELAVFGPTAFDVLSTQKRVGETSLRAAARIHGIPPCEDGQLGTCNRGWIGAPGLWEPWPSPAGLCPYGASATCVLMTTSLEGRTPQSAAPWFRAEVTPVDATTVRITLESKLEVSPELVAFVYLNVDPRVDPTHLRILHDWRNSTGPPATSVELGRECCTAVNGRFDIAVTFPTSLSGARFDGSEVVVYIVECAFCTDEELAVFGAGSFDFESIPTKVTASPHRMAVRIHGIPPCDDGQLGSCNRGWIGE